jgi:putative chitinase
MDAQTLSRAAGISLPRAQQWALPLTAAMREFAINTPVRQADFIAQMGHESMSFARTREIWNPAQVPAQARYEGRADLGNTQPGDGMRFMGRGLPMITGRANYAALSKAVGMDFVKNPQLLERDDYAALAGGWFWSLKGLNELADRGEFLTQSIRINGKNANGLPNGWVDRTNRRAAARRALGLA